MSRTHLWRRNLKSWVPVLALAIALAIALAAWLLHSRPAGEQRAHDELRDLAGRAGEENAATRAGLTAANASASATPDSLAAARAELATVLAKLPACGAGELQPPAAAPLGSVDVEVRPEDASRAQAIADQAGAGAVLLIQPGRYARWSVRPRQGQTYLLMPGVILDGQRAVDHVFSPGENDVTIRALDPTKPKPVIENYTPDPQSGAIQGKGTTGWTVEGIEVRENWADRPGFQCTSPSGCGGMGIKIGEKMVVRHNHLHHNDQYGVGGNGAGVLIEGNEIAFNNYRNRVRQGHGAGGTKFVKTNGLIVRGNYVHDNHGPGLWTDIDNRNSVIEGNRVENNHKQGIFHEISHAAVIRNNTVIGNGLVARHGWLYGAGILIAHSDNVEVCGNTVEGNWNGIVGIQQDRGAHELKNLWVHDNTVRMEVGASGVGSGGGAALDPFTSAANNRFARNTYTISAGIGLPFRWQGRVSRDRWRALFPLDGSVTVLP